MSDPWYENIKVKPNSRKFPRPALKQQLAEGVRSCRLETGRGNQTIGVIQRVMDALGYELLVMWDETRPQA